MSFSVFKNINQFAGRSKMLDDFLIFCARTLPYIMAIFLLVFYIYQRSTNIFLYALLSGLFARFVINEFIHLFYKRERPAHLEMAKVLIPVPKSYSFPSGHASFFFGISFFLIFYNIYLSLIFIFLSSLIGIARVFCGVHWFRDVLAGALVGLISALIMYGPLNYLKF